ncbi:MULTISPECIES: glutathione S-transferase family protein [unclassified Okeania]|uniref:glutathione S-transferase family protein n=1 Tax=unclassified Okeania TaxID=2634635 RepID=UPI0013B6027C|nr:MULTISPECIES: glutathione S-transferase family protein [unclassified Okeania]NET11869.1 glutathione S-transferase family protein [Okeania sp. SIO1H6]NES78961.1 glutathione S-transferase family protein [Okeania sp. SIO1H4]NET22735.1 glutathione S-transferase family protein [Okeania sp. SIO1H5]NET76899.1 glutathione S-transferase family protein [Okeania sp. SIO1F9]NET95708.1 glutathione S-transferase family protein [Okeania sp. SIO1H2]
MTRILYYHPLSNFSRKIRILLAEKKLDYKLKEVNLRNKPAEFMEISPIGKVPVFVEEDGTVIWDSTLIAEYLDENYPEPKFYPTYPQAKLECRKWEELADYLGDNIINLWILNLTNNLEPTFYRTKLETSINDLLPVFDRQLAKSKYLLGNEEWTIADVSALCSFGYYSLRLNEDWLLEYDNLKNWFNRLHQRESVKSTVPLNKE